MRRGAGRARLHRDGRVDRRRRRHRARRPAARRRGRQRRPHRSRDRRARRARCARAARAAASRPRRRAPPIRAITGRAAGRGAARGRRAHRARWSAGRWRRSPTCSTCGSRSSPARSRSASATPFFAAAQAELDRSARLDFSRGARIVPAGLGADGPLVVRPRSAGRAGDARRQRACGAAVAASLRVGRRWQPDVPAGGRRLPGEDPGVPRRAPPGRTGRASARSATTRRRRSPRSGGARCTSTATSRRDWPKEYGGGGLTALEQVILAEEFERAGRADRHRQRRVLDPDDRQHAARLGHRRAEAALPPADPLRRGPLVPGLLRAERRQRPRQPRQRAVLDGDEWVHQRPEDLDVRRPPRQLDLRAVPHRRRRAEAQGHHVPARARWTSRASRCARSR